MSVPGFPSLRRNGAPHRDIMIQATLNVATEWGEAAMRMTFVLERSVPDSAGFENYFAALKGRKNWAGPEQWLDQALEDMMNELVPRYVRLELNLDGVTISVEDRQPGYRGPIPSR